MKGTGQFLESERKYLMSKMVHDIAEWAATRDRETFSERV